MALAGVHISGRSSPNSENQPPTANLIDIDSLNTKLNNNSLLVHTNPINEVNQIIFNSQITQKQWERVQEDISNEEVQLLPNRVTETTADDPVSFVYFYINSLIFSRFFLLKLISIRLFCNILQMVVAVLEI